MNKEIRMMKQHKSTNDTTNESTHNIIDNDIIDNDEPNTINIQSVPKKLHPLETVDVITKGRTEMKVMNFKKIRLRRKLRIERHEKCILSLYEKMIHPTNELDKEIEFLNDNTTINAVEKSIENFRTLKYTK